MPEAPCWRSRSPGKVSQTTTTGTITQSFQQSARFCSCTWSNLITLFGNGLRNFTVARFARGRVRRRRQADRFLRRVQAAALEPASAEALTGLGLSHKALGQFAEAKEAFQQALCVSPAWAVALGNLAGLHFEAGELTHAVGAYQQAIRLQPHFPEAYNNLGNTLRCAAAPFPSLCACLCSLPVLYNNLGNTLRCAAPPFPNLQPSTSATRCGAPRLSSGLFVLACSACLCCVPALCACTVCLHCVPGLFACAVCLCCCLPVLFVCAVCLCCVPVSRLATTHGRHAPLCNAPLSFVLTDLFWRVPLHPAEEHGNRAPHIRSKSTRKKHAQRRPSAAAAPARRSAAPCSHSGRLTTKGFDQKQATVAARCPVRPQRHTSSQLEQDAAPKRNIRAGVQGAGAGGRCF